MPPPSNRRRRQRPPAADDLSPPERAELERRRLLDTPLAEVAETTALRVRAVNALEGAGVIFVKDLLALSAERLLEIGNFGEKTLDDIRKALRSLGLKPPWKAKRKPPARKPKRRAK